jgi:hypothetical protein
MDHTPESKHHDIVIEDPALTEHGFTKFSLPLNGNATVMIVHNIDNSKMMYPKFYKSDLDKTVQSLRDKIVSDNILIDDNTADGLVAYFRNAGVLLSEDEDSPFFKNENGNGKAHVPVSIKRSGFILEIEGTGASITFYAYDKDRTFDAIISKCQELGLDLTLDDIRKQDDVIMAERHNIDVQLTSIYKEYYEKLEAREIRDEDQLLILANSQIKHRFRDQTDRFYAVIIKEGNGNSHQEIINMDYEEFDQFLIKTFYDSEKRLIGKDKRNNAKTLLKAYTMERRLLYDRIARVGDDIYYDLNNDPWQCVKIAKDGKWDIVDNPLLFRRISDNRLQVLPDRDYDHSRHYIREIIENSTIKHEHQKLIDEVYTISLFIPDIAHPIIVPIGPRGSGKTMHLRIKKLIVDPRETFDALVEKLPRDDRDRRVAIYDNYISYYDNESMLSYEEMDELCMWVTGYSKTIRILNTTDERRTYSGKRIIGINGINIPVSNSDILNRSFISEFTAVPDGTDGKDSKLVVEYEYLSKIKADVPYILAYIFDIVAKTLQKYDQVAAATKSNHRLADFVIWGETISQVLGHHKGEFLKAWKLNAETQNLAVIHNNSLATLVIKYVFNKRPEMEFSIEPEDLLKELKDYADDIGIDYHNDRQLPRNAVWLTRKLNMIKSDLRTAGIIIDPIKSNERQIWIRKDSTYNKQEYMNKKEDDDKKTREFALDRFKKFLAEKNTEKVTFYDFQMDLTSSGKFYVGDAFRMIEIMIKEGLLVKGDDGLLSIQR